MVAQGQTFELFEMNQGCIVNHNASRMPEGQVHTFEQKVMRAKLDDVNKTQSALSVSHASIPSHTQLADLYLSGYAPRRSLKHHISPCHD